MCKKQDLRKQLKLLRNNESQKNINLKSKTIQNTLFDHTLFKKAHNILFYVSYGHEVFTHDMIKDALSLGKKVIVPISDVNEKNIIPSVLLGWSDLSKGAYGILEPKPEHIHPLPSEDIELIIIPGVGFDEKGNRLGHGQGYYDRLLNKVGYVSLVALAFEFQILDHIPIEAHDRKVDYIFTEKRIISCK